MMMMRRGFAREATKSWMVKEGWTSTPPARVARNSSVRVRVRLKTATGKPLRSMLRARFSPMTARPMTPTWRSVVRGPVWAVGAVATVMGGGLSRLGGALALSPDPSPKRGGGGRAGRRGAKGGRGFPTALAARRDWKGFGSGADLAEYRGEVG